MVTILNFVTLVTLAAICWLCAVGTLVKMVTIAYLFYHGHSFYLVCYRYNCLLSYFVCLCYHSFLCQLGYRTYTVTMISVVVFFAITMFTAAKIVIM
jgi:hypothetical protein